MGKRGASDGWHLPWPWPYCMEMPAKTFPRPALVGAAGLLYDSRSMHYGNGTGIRGGFASSLRIGEEMGD